MTASKNEDPIFGVLGMRIVVDWGLFPGPPDIAISHMSQGVYSDRSSPSFGHDISVTMLVASTKTWLTHIC